ncbi:MAG: hypothetical protein KFF73_00760 [Cyclobacteriaceae bacterium]|nr:hypothetical protein [Cyclobacteriaceae bacterium]
MKDLRSHIISRIISILLIGIAGIYMLNYTMYTHRHITTDGRVIIHSHPYDKNDSKPYKSHSHSKSELLLLDAFKILLFFTSALFLFMFQERVLFFPVIQVRVLVNFPFRHRAIRAPPSV